MTDGLVISGDLHEDPDAILLLGGDKAGRWKQWYDEAISPADRRYDRRLGSCATGASSMAAEIQATGSE